MKARVFVSGHLVDKKPSILRRMEAIKKFLEESDHEVILEIDVPYPSIEEDVEKSISDDINQEKDMITWVIMMVTKIMKLAKCDMLFLLPNWKQSVDGKILSLIAGKLDIPIYLDNGSVINLTDENEIENWFKKSNQEIKLPQLNRLSLLRDKRFFNTLWYNNNN